ncbi:MAG TPA: DNA translocase FtsK [Firmicutes bacterium]|nr:DNA translocase FtsK [Bacillota bacterium]
MVSKKRSKKREENPQSDIKGVIFVGLAVLVFLALVTYSPLDPPQGATGEKIHNFIGLMGAYASHFFLLFLGDLAFIIPILFFIGGINAFMDQKILAGRKGVLFVLAAAAFIILLQINNVQLFTPLEWGGMFPEAAGAFMLRFAGKVGTYIILAVLMFLILPAFIPLLILKKGWDLAAGLFSFARKVPRKKTPKRDLHQKRLPKREKTEKKERIKKEKPPQRTPGEEFVYHVRYFKAVMDKTDTKEKDIVPGHAKADEPQLLGFEQSLSEIPDSGPIPPTELLSYLVQKQEEEDTVKVAMLLEDALAEYSIQGRVVNVEKGPMVSLYEVDVEKGIKLNKIVSLDRELSLFLSKTNIRIIAPLPGRGTVGFEIPNKNRNFISLRENIERNEFKNSPSPLTVGFGKGTNGEPVIIRIDELPHLLIAGATMSGKSIGIHTIIMSILYKATYEDVRMLLIDPKRLEFPYYNGIPHLLSDVIVETHEAVNVLKWALYEMERRYKFLAHHGYRDIQSFNEANPNEKLPFILIVIDELADLLVTAGQDVEQSIIRLGQKARAIGINLILATQRPSVDVITGTIKANFPATIAFKTSSSSNSRIILGTNGAETLLGKGDFLYHKMSGEIVRGQASLVTVEEISRTVQYLRRIKRGEDEYKEMFEKDKEITLEMDDKDELFPEVIRLIYNNLMDDQNTISTSYIQRKFSIGYNRAARIIDSLAEAGIIDEEGGSKGRLILVDVEALKDFQ